LYSKKTRVTENEIELALSIMERRNPSFFENNEISDINDLNVIKFSDINNNNNNSEE
jgi:hypothetical protein